MAKDIVPLLCFFLTVLVSVHVEAQLPVPTSIVFTLVQAKSVTLTIQVSGANGKTLRTVFTSSDGHTVQLNGMVSSNFAILQVNGLRPGTTYTVRAFVVDGSTQGQAKVSTVTTTADVPSGPVRGLNTSSISSRSVVLTWNAPEDKYINSGNGLTGYYVELRRFEGNRCEGKVQSANVTPNSRSVTFNGLQPATRYCVIVFPENEGGRARELHASGGKTTFTTQQDAPSDSPTLRLVQPQFTQLTLAWDEPSQPNGQLTQYVIQYRQGSTGRWMESTVSASAKYKLFTSGFDSGSRYQVRIAAVNAVGRGPFSTSVQFTMRPPVYDIGVCRLSSTSAKFVWKLRSQPSMGGELTQLRFTLSTSGQRKEYTVDKTSSGIERGGLMNKEYRLSVVLVWSEGDRLYFQPDRKDLGRLQTDPNCFPTKPRDLISENDTVHSQNFTITWSEPAKTNGPILKYITKVKSKDSRLPYNKTFEGMSTRLTVSGLEEAVQCTVKVRAVNRFGEGPNAVLSVRTRDSAPNGPASNIRVERISTTAVEVTWEDPAHQYINAVGGITGYEVVIGSKNCRRTEKSSETTNLKVVFDGLKPGTVYCVRVFPLNNIGATPDDIVRNSSVRVELPDVLSPPKMIGQTVVNTHAVIIWEKVESTDEENPVTNYTIDSSSSNKPITLPPDSEYYNVTGLSPGREYTVKVAAKNAIGVGRNTTFNITTKATTTQTTTLTTTQTTTQTTTLTTTQPTTQTITQTTTETITQTTTQPTTQTITTTKTRTKTQTTTQIITQTTTQTTTQAITVQPTNQPTTQLTTSQPTQIGGGTTGKVDETPSSGNSTRTLGSSECTCPKSSAHETAVTTLVVLVVVVISLLVA